MNSFTTLTDIFESGVFEPMTLLDERLAIVSAKDGDKDATTRLLRAYAPAIRAGVAWYTSRSLNALQQTDVDDIRSAAVLGVLDAIQAFDLEKHERLAAIVARHIDHEISAQADVVPGFTVPSRTLSRFFGILRAASGNVYEAARLAQDYNMRTETFLAVLGSLRDVDSIDEITSAAYRGTDGAGTDLVASPLWDNKTPDVEDRILVEAAFAAMDTLEKDVIRLAYGFIEADPVPDAEIGHRFGLSRQKTQRTRALGLAKARIALGVA